VRPILTPAEAVELDRAAQARGISAADLMERAGEAVARAAEDLAGGAYGRRAVVVCGKGNNGGDGFVAARRLARRGMRVDVLTLEPADELREPAATNARRMSEVDARVLSFSPAAAARALERADVAIDAIFGTGFRGTPEDAFAEAIDALNEAGAMVVAVDIPSGVNGETGAVEGDAVWAEATVALGAEKVGTVLPPGAERAGFVEVADIGYPRDLIHADIALVESVDVATRLPARELDTHKRATGVVLVVGGSREMTGAMRLVGTAAYRIGAGLVTIAVPREVAIVVQQGLAEATYLPLPETAEGGVAREALGELLDAASRVDAVALGPGMGRRDETAELVRAFVRESPAPMIIDADALNAFEARAGELSERRSDAVLTPHAGEFSRLSGASVREVSSDRVGHVRKLAASTGAVVLLKGSRTAIGSPEGFVRINATGTSVLATAGSGDVLTGAIAGLVARGLEPADAASAGAFLHGVAGHLAGRATGDGTMASDIAGMLPEAVRDVVEPAGIGSRWVES
jgi:ADP-dependent NAD(P)H-hydrate dehydratase / NAD(P)H-hydrate epimerase